MLSAYWSVAVDWTWAVWMPKSFDRVGQALERVWLNDLSSKPPESETMQALKSGASSPGKSTLPALAVLRTVVAAVVAPAATGHDEGGRGHGARDRAMRLHGASRVWVSVDETGPRGLPGPPVDQGVCRTSTRWGLPVSLVIGR